MELVLVFAFHFMIFLLRISKVRNFVLISDIYHQMSEFYLFYIFFYNLCDIEILKTVVKVRYFEIFFPAPTGRLYK